MRTGKNALIANYGSGSFAVFPLAANGEVQPMSAFIQDHGSSVNPDRQGRAARALSGGRAGKSSSMAAIWGWTK
jgi:6-phosphogluconolactonase (cycloisomerase 2 family)